MTVQEFLKENTAALQKAGIHTARLDCLVLLEDVLNRGRANLLAHTDDVIPPAEMAKLNNFITQRKTHLPLAYIRGKANFYGREFRVNTQVLVPRPETESIIELAKRLPINSPRVADIGCGSGCIGVTFALEKAGSKVTLIDIDQSALKTAIANAKRLNADVQFRQNNLLNGINDTFDIVLANLPYVPNKYQINKAATYEPRIALFAGNDGLDLYRVLWRQISSQKNSTRYVITESLMEQHNELQNIAKTAGYQLVKTDGLAQLFAKS